MSPSNTRAEIELKLRRYGEAPHNLYALVIEPREFRLDVYAKSRAWQRQSYVAPDERIDLVEFGASCLLRDLYRGTPLDPRRH